MTVTFFGHKATPKEIETTLRATLVDLIENHGATEFYVGNNGNFDTLVRRQLEDLSHTYPITYSVVLAYLPTKKASMTTSPTLSSPKALKLSPNASQSLTETSGWSSSRMSL